MSSKYMSVGDDSLEGTVGVGGSVGRGDYLWNNHDDGELNTQHTIDTEKDV